MNKVGNEPCPKCFASHPQSLDCTITFAPPNHPPETLAMDDLKERLMRKAEHKSEVQHMPESSTLEGKALAYIEALEQRVSELEDLLDTERYKVAIGVQAITRAVQGRQWLSQPGRGSYAYNDERYQQEFGAALDEILAALKPLRAIAQDWSNSPHIPLRVEANRQAARDILNREPNP
jgi:hypothetical protein